MNRQAAAILGTGALTVLFLIPVLRGDGTVADPIIDPQILIEPKRGDRFAPDANALPDVLDYDIDPGTYIITGTVTVPTDVEAHIADGTRLLADMDARIVVHGTLSVRGASLKSNEKHPDRQIWHGIVAQPEGRINIADTSISNATAAITCAAGSSGTIADMRFFDNTADTIFLPGSECES